MPTHRQDLSEAATASSLQRMVDSMTTNYLEESLRSEFDALENEIKQNVGALAQRMDTRTADMKNHVGVEVKALERMIADAQTELHGIIEKEITMVNQDIQRESDEINQRLSSSITACTSARASRPGSIWGTPKPRSVTLIE